MKKLFSAVLLSACFCLTACEASANSASAKSALQANGYSVRVLNEADAKTDIKNVTWNVSIVDVVDATKDGKEFYLGFYCNNINDADAFSKENISRLYNYALEYTETPKVGSYNNVAYCATPAAFAILGFK